METIHGTVSRILFSNEETGYKVLSIKTISGSPTIVVGEFGPEIIPETPADFHGDFKTHAKYGNQFRANSYHVSDNVEELASIKLFIDEIAPNIGPERAQYITNAFGKDLFRIIEEEPERLLEVEGIGKSLSNNLIEAWKENKDAWTQNRQVYSLRTFLYSLGLKERRVKKILKHFGSGLAAEEKIRENPYALVEIEGIGFSSADFIARKLGVSESEPNRLKAFLWYLIDRVCPSNGHLYLPINSLHLLSNSYCNDNGTSFLGKNNLEEKDLTELLIDLQDSKKIHIEDDNVYSTKNYVYEHRSASMLVNMITKKSDLIFLTKEAIEEHISNFERENGLALSKEQKDALYCFADQKVFVITGGPGTGKTTILKAIVEMTRAKRLNLTCLTPTGISAKKLSMTVDYNAYTIHRRLGYRGNEWLYHENNTFNTDVVITDESSMIDQEVFFRLVSALDKRTHMIIVGDQDQLPSVGAGNVLKELINSGVVPVVKLEKIFRQAEASNIIKAAHRIKSGNTDLSLFSSDPKNDVFFIRMTNPDEIMKIIVQLAQKFKKEKRMFQIITPRNEGPLSVNSLNEDLQKILNPESKEPSQINMGKFILRRGDRIMVRKNDYGNDIYNGDIGKITHIGSGRVRFEIDGRIIDLSVEEIGEKIKLAYSISIHKSQGLEYPYIILPFINQFGRNMLQRNLIYTAITRAREKVIVLGHGSAIEKAIQNANVTKRNTKLGERIFRCFQQRKKDSSYKPLLGSGESRNVESQRVPLSFSADQPSATDSIYD